MSGPQSHGATAEDLYRLTDGQRELLGWVAEGCPEGRYSGTSHRISVRALHARGLVRIRGRGRTWQCEITPTGRRHLDEGTHPTPAVTEGRDPGETEERPRSRPATSPAAKTDRLVHDLIEAGGTLIIPATEPDGTGVRQRAYAAQAAGKLPEGMALTTRTIGHRIELRLIPAEYPGGERVAVAEAEPVVVPEMIDKLDPIAARFTRSVERHEISRGSLERATRLVHAIALECRRRRWQVAAPPRITAGRLLINWRPAIDRHIWITAAGVEFRIRVREEGVRHRGRLEAEQKSAAESRFWDLYRKRPVPEGEHDRGATGRLEPQLDGGRTFGDRRRRSNWRDRANRQLEELLPELFAEIATRVIEGERAVDQARLDEIARQERARQAALERERRWHELMEEARAAFLEDRRRRDLESNLADWEMSRRIDVFIQAAEEAHGDDPLAAEWLSWAIEARERINPLTSAPILPGPIEPRPEDLRPFLPAGWSPYNP